MIIKRTILTVLVILVQLYCKGQELVFNHLMAEDGLSQNSIFSITQDSRGFMWYGSRFGLNRYDGIRFSLYKSSSTDTSTLSDDYVTALYNDTKGILWVGTANGLNKFDPRKNTFKRIRLAKVTGDRPYILVRNIQEDSRGRVWIASNKGLFFLSDRSSDNFSGAEKLGLPLNIAKSDILSVFEDHDHELWIGTNNGLVRLSIKKRIEAIKIFVNDNRPGSITDNSVTGTVEDLQKNLWFATENGGINLFDRNTQTFTAFKHEAVNNDGPAHNAIRKMIMTRSGEVWIGTQEGLSILNPQTRKFRNFQHRKANSKSLNQNSIYSIYQDINGSVWIGTYYGGVNVVYAAPTNFKTWQYHEQHPGLNHNVVSAITEDKNGKLWIGTEGGGLNYYNWNNKHFGAYTYNANDPESLGSNLVKAVYKDKTGDIWVGTHGGGLNLLNQSTGKFTRYLTHKNDLNTTRSEIVALLEDSYGRFWVGSQTGLRIFDKANSKLQPKPLSGKLKIFEDKNIKFLFEDAQKNIWIAATTGLYAFSRDLKVLQSFRLPKVNNSVSNNSNFINCIIEDQGGNIWIGLYYGGLKMYDPKKRSFSRTYGIKDGLLSSNVLGIIEDDKRQLWISTSNGLSKFDPQTHTFQTYITSDGLAGDEFNYNSFFKGKHQEFFFGGYNGLTHFFPDQINKNNYRAPIVFTDLLLFNKPVKIGTSDGLLEQDLGFTSKLQLKYDQNIFTIQFALLNYIKSKKNKYAYKLQGVNTQWIETSIPAASYTNLPSGNYTLLVKGANNDGLWSKAASIQIEILPPFWKTWWAFCIYSILVVAIVFFITRFFYLRELLIKDEELHQNKLNFFTNVSHEIRTHLTLIMAPIEKMLDSSRQTAELNKEMSSVKSNADRLLKLVSELMDFRKAETRHLKLKIAAHDLVGFLQNIYNSFESLSEKKQIDYTLIYDQESLIVYFDKEQLEKVFFNLISNAFKFTPAGGQIAIALKTLSDKVVVNITDTGRGIAPEYMDRLFTNFFQIDDHNIQNTGYGIGLALSKHITELHKGSIAVNSIPAQQEGPGYTNFTVTLQLGNRHFKNTGYLQPEGSATENNKSSITPPAEHSGTSKTTDNSSKAKAHTVLIVEDNAALRQLITESLEQEYHIITAKNGVQGWTKATEEVPDLIVSDVMMPQMDGFTLCGKLKSDERTSHIPVILLTAKSTETDQISGLTGGADVYLTKPFSQKILQLNVRNLLTARAVMRQKFSRQLILEPQQIALAPVEEQFLSKLILIIENNMENEHFGVEQLAEGIGMSQSVLYKKLKALTNMSVNDFAKSIRLKRAAQLLLKKQFTVYEIGYMVGFADRKYFSREFKKQFGKTPSEYMDAE